MQKDMWGKPAILSIGLLVLAGCQFTPEQQLIGAWSADPTRVHIPNFPFAGLDEKLMAGMDSAQLKLSADHTFMFTGLSQIGGKWIYKDGVVTLEPSRDARGGFAQLEDQNLVLRLDSTFTTMTLIFPTAFGDMRLVLNKTA